MVYCIYLSCRVARASRPPHAHPHEGAAATKGASQASCSHGEPARKRTTLRPPSPPADVAMYNRQVIDGGLLEFDVKRESEQYYNRKAKRKGAESDVPEIGNRDILVTKDGLTVNLRKFKPVTKIKDNIQSMYALEVQKGEGNEPSSRQNHVYIQVAPEVSSDYTVNATAVRCETPGYNGVPPIEMNHVGYFEHIFDTLNLVDATNQEVLDRSIHSQADAQVSGHRMPRAHAPGAPGERGHPNILR